MENNIKIGKTSDSVSQLESLCIEKAEEMAKIYMEEGVNNVSDWINIQKFQEKQMAEDKYGNKRQYTPIEATQIYKLANKYDIANKAGNEDRTKVIEQMIKDMKIGESSAAKLYDISRNFVNMKD